MIRRRGIQYPGKCCFKRLPRTRERERFESKNFSSRGSLHGFSHPLHGFPFVFTVMEADRRGRGMDVVWLSIRCSWNMECVAERFRLSPFGVISLLGSSCTESDRIPASRQGSIRDVRLFWNGRK